MNAKDLILELLKLDKEDWDKEVETEGCDCFGACASVEAEGDRIVLYRYGAPQS